MTNPGFPIPPMEGNSGKVVRVNPDGSKTTIVDGLDFPSAMAFAPDGDLYISNDGFGPPTGSIVRVDLGHAGCHA
jgi:sugar lactone lactonase YvrE